MLLQTPQCGEEGRAGHQHKQPGEIRKEGYIMEKAKVYFTKQVTPEAMTAMYEALGLELPGKVAVKVHSGEMGNQNFIRPEFMEPVIRRVDGIVTECNTAYEGKRNTTKEHWETMAAHGWTRLFQKGKQSFRFQAENGLLLIMWAHISKITTPFSYFPISRDILWEVSAER